MALLVPKVLEVEQYGYLRIFTLYLSFVGIAHFGFNDGIFVKYGKYSLDDLPKERFRTYFRFLLVFQIIIGILLSVLIFLFIKQVDRQIVYLFVSINLILVNLIAYFNFVYQITKEFKIFSRVTLIQNLILLLGTLTLVFAEINTYIPYVLVQTVAYLLILILYIMRSRAFVFGEKTDIKEMKTDISENFKIGIYILIGNLMSVVILSVARVLIDNFYTLEDFTFYAFAVTLLGLAFSFISAFSSYFYTYIRRTEVNKLSKLYSEFYSYLIVGGAIALSSFFIIKPIVIRILPDYVPALEITRWLYPSIITQASIMLLGVNLYKTLRLEKDFNRNNWIICFVIITLNSVGIYLQLGINDIAILNLLGFCIWLVYNDIYFAKKLKVNIFVKNLYMFFVIIVFLSTSSMYWLKGLVIYIVLIIAFYLIDKLTFKQL
ncbi:oligosaccharide flippase family protein [Bacillus cereus group sp. N6]|uniref:lipopolysaccharide biosynthesis protein n=1 Tax=Bacillus cereus group sp. N6 TaxID=2794583 RepID=UPI0018F3DBAC|nr:oligosaccharide flippase family protein [Bacillus cereus group sp. N6]MBJ8111777.1 oligosaccharide flippase family protein [Bacillus cereus group sp. N6]